MTELKQEMKMAYTTEQRGQLLSDISDAHKDAYGFRPRTDSSNMSDEQIDAWYDDVCADANRVFEEETQQNVKSLSAWNVRLNKIMEMGAGDRITAIKWDMQAYNTTSADDYCWEANIPFEAIGEIRSLLG